MVVIDIRIAKAALFVKRKNFIFIRLCGSSLFIYKLLFNNLFIYLFIYLLNCNLLFDIIINYFFKISNVN